MDKKRNKNTAPSLTTMPETVAGFFGVKTSRSSREKRRFDFLQYDRRADMEGEANSN
jgi:hypothetical protein